MHSLRLAIEEREAGARYVLPIFTLAFFPSAYESVFVFSVRAVFRISHSNLFDRKKREKRLTVVRRDDSTDEIKLNP